MATRLWRFALLHIAVAPTLLALLFVCGCQAGAPEFEKTRTFEAPVEHVWRATEEALYDEFLRVEEADRRALTIQTKLEQFGSGKRIIDAVSVRPYVIVSVWSRARHQMTIGFAPHDEGTDVTIDTKIEAFEMNATRRWHECASNGRLESDLFKAIEKRLKKPSP